MDLAWVPPVRLGLTTIMVERCNPIWEGASVSSFCLGLARSFDSVSLCSGWAGGAASLPIGDGLPGGPHPNPPPAGGGDFWFGPPPGGDGIFGLPQSFFGPSTPFLSTQDRLPFPFGLNEMERRRRVEVGLARSLAPPGHDRLLPQTFIIYLPLICFTPLCSVSLRSGRTEGGRSGCVGWGPLVLS